MISVLIDIFKFIGTVSDRIGSVTKSDIISSSDVNILLRTVFISKAIEFMLDCFNKDHDYSVVIESLNRMFKDDSNSSKSIITNSRKAIYRIGADLIDHNAKDQPLPSHDNILNYKWVFCDRRMKYIGIDCNGNKQFEMSVKKFILSRAVSLLLELHRRIILHPRLKIMEHGKAIEEVVRSFIKEGETSLIKESMEGSHCVKKGCFAFVSFLKDVVKIEGKKLNNNPLTKEASQILERLSVGA
jgi:hypothetical protein